ncbi:MAG: hypothetical protein QM831_17545 [Kofleriaceae bacterium]
MAALAIDPNGGELVVRGRVADDDWQQVIKVPAQKPGDGNQAIAALYGRERVADVEAHAMFESRDGEIEDLGMTYQIATKMTSWVAIDDSRTVSGKTREQVIPQELPHGTSMESFGLRLAGMTMRQTRTQTMGGVIKDEMSQLISSYMQTRAGGGAPGGAPPMGPPPARPAGTAPRPAESRPLPVDTFGDFDEDAREEPVTYGRRSSTMLGDDDDRNAAPSEIFPEAPGSSFEREEPTGSFARAKIGAADKSAAENRPAMPQQQPMPHHAQPPLLGERLPGVPRGQFAGTGPALEESAKRAAKKLARARRNTVFGTFLILAVIIAALLWWLLA